MKTYLSFHGINSDAARYRSKAAAIRAYERAARELERIGQPLEATLHYANSREELNEYPDFVCSLGPRGGLKIERA